MRALLLVLLLVCVAPSAAGVESADPSNKTASLLTRAQEQFEQGDLGAAYRLALQSGKTGRNRQPFSEWELLTKICCRSGMLKEATGYAERYLDISARLGGSGASGL